MEAGDVGEEEGMNDGEVNENMIVVCLAHRSLVISNSH